MPGLTRKRNPIYVHHETPSGIQEVIAIAEAKWGYAFHRHGNEASGACPVVCKGGDDRFILFADGGYYCRQCGSTGWVTEEDNFELTKQEMLERRVAVLEQGQQEIRKRLSALEEMNTKTEDVDKYHAALNEKALAWWHEKQGVAYNSIAKYKLGYCESCPTAPGSPSFTIPYYDISGNLINIRHRLEKPKSGKYRPHMAGLGLALYQEGILPARKVLLLEGEVKTIVLAQTLESQVLGIVGIMGKKGFKPEWVSKFADTEEITIALDPDASEAAEELGEALKDYGGKLKIASFPAKPDDMVVALGATEKDMLAYLDLARPI